MAPYTYLANDHLPVPTTVFFKEGGKSRRTSNSDIQTKWSLDIEYMTSIDVLCDKNTYPQTLPMSVLGKIDRYQDAVTANKKYHVPRAPFDLNNYFVTLVCNPNPNPNLNPTHNHNPNPNPERHPNPDVIV